jgi:hypothetical protein
VLLSGGMGGGDYTGEWIWGPSALCKSSSDALGPTTSGQPICSARAIYAEQGRMRCLLDHIPDCEIHHQ